MVLFPFQAGRVHYFSKVNPTKANYAIFVDFWMNWNQKQYISSIHIFELTVWPQHILSLSILPSFWLWNFHLNSHFSKSRWFSISFWVFPDSWWFRNSRSIRYEFWEAHVFHFYVKQKNWQQVWMVKCDSTDHCIYSTHP